jgi:tRNA nucleotidyltransferase (CCA-adding enzyme)
MKPFTRLKLLNKKIEKIISEVKRRIAPNEKHRRHVLKLAEKFRGKVEEEIRKRKLSAEVRLQGSIAKDTWLKDDADIDIFMLLPEETPKEALGRVYLEAARASLKGYKIVERFAEHPYVEASVTRNIKVNIVPCYKVKPPNWKSATDRTPYHTEYVKAKLNDTTRSEVRVLKKFMKGVNVYGSDIKVGGFSGYLTELLIIYYGSFLKVLQEALRWKPGEIIDVEDLYGEFKDDARRLFREAFLIVVDPVDKSRNVASPLRPETLNVFRASAKFFLKNPSIKYFYPSPLKPFSLKTVRKNLQIRGSEIIFLKIGRIEAVPDILWGQIYKTKRALRNLLENYEFKVLRDTAWSDESENSILLFEVENSRLNKAKKHVGPPITSVEEEKFLRKYISSKNVISGPYIENGRWVVILSRTYQDAKSLLKDNLIDGGRSIGVASRISQSMVKFGFQVLEGDEILSFYRRNKDFARFLTDFLDGKPQWLSLEKSSRN